MQKKDFVQMNLLLLYAPFLTIIRMLTCRSYKSMKHSACAMNMYDLIMADTLEFNSLQTQNTQMNKELVVSSGPRGKSNPLSA